MGPAVDDENRLIIISGLSGSGKSIALHALEDLGYYCIDNMPAGLLRSLLDELKEPDNNAVARIAVSVDARNRRPNLETLPALIDDIRRSGISTDLLFLQADDEVLLQRYSATRRRHPLANFSQELRTAILQERELLCPVIIAADLIVDTSRTSVYELADIIQTRVDHRKTNELSILLQSFSFKHGIPADADFVFDLRCLPNPYWNNELRSLTGLDDAVAEYLEGQPSFVQMYEDILGFLQKWIPEYVSVNRSYLTVALGCTGGQHRSVRMAENLAEALSKRHAPVQKRHNRLSQLGVKTP